ncbi:protein-export chaperone SecB [Neisseriaceae bacterium ESL0693]|nr:protein-export chaperone SecB [Neisseriaceae bacterium ESL0693]
MSEQEQATEQQPVFSIEKIYVKDLSLEVPHAPRVFLDNGEPQVEMRIATSSDKLEDHFYDVTVTVTVTAKLTEDKVMFLNEVAQSGIFRIENVAEDDIQLLLAVAAPNILFPYAREVVSSTITRAGFPPVMLAPINFEAMYQAQQAQEAANETGSNNV